MMSSCHRNVSLERALRHAGKNRAELEKVLEYYKGDPNPLKLQAARFLIENMPGHCTLVGEEVEEYYRRVDSVLAIPGDLSTRKKRIDGIVEAYPEIRSNVVEDIHVISHEFLVKNIEAAFRTWEEKPHARHLDFEQFCEYLLPYKCTELQQLDDWRDTMCRRFDPALEREIYNDQYYKSAYYATLQIGQKILEAGTRFDLPIDNRRYLFLNASLFSRMPLGECGDYSIQATAILRSQGIASTADFIPLWNKEGGGHAWYTLLNNNGKFLSCRWGVGSNPSEAFFPEESCAKIFRYSYVANPRVVEYLRESAYKHPAFNMFHRDVTREYIRTSDLSIPVSNTRGKDKYVYLAVYNDRAWNVIDFGVVKRGRARFSDVGHGIAYIVMEHDGERLTTISEPFLLHENGRVEYRVADKGSVHAARLVRKYPKLQHTAHMESRLLGGKIEASNDENFSSRATLYSIDSLPLPDLIPLPDTVKYRYWRYYSTRGGYCIIAELQFYEKGYRTVAKGRIIGTDKIHQNDTSMSREKAFDGNWLTFFHAPDPDGGWIGLDFGKPVSIDRVRCVPRSDDNGIHFGDTYELTYWHQGAWRSLGARVARDNVLYYDNIPANALLLLHDHTRGVQERPFVIENGKQVWW
jgi:hypothetical protein